LIQPPHIDPRNYQINGVLMKRIWRLTRPYWLRRQAWRSWIALGVLIVMAPAFSLLMAYTSFVLKDLTNLIIARKIAAYWPMMVWFLSVTALGRIGGIFLMQIDSRLNLHWRKWLTTYLVDRYLAKRTYYDIAVAEDLDNPDQRIQESVAPFTQIVSFFPRQMLGNLTTMAAGAAILATIDMRLLTVVGFYAFVQSVVMYFFYVPTVKQNFEITVAEADLRYGILHVRDNAETVAFYRGEASEQVQILDRLKTAVKKQLVLIRYQIKLFSATFGFGVVWMAVPYVLLVPMFFAGKINYGSIAQGTMAATQVLSSLGIFIDFLPTISAAAPQAVRLAEILERFDLMDADRMDPSIPRLVLRRGTEVRLDNVSLETPGGEQSLVQNLSLRLSGDDQLVIVGQTGVGKSSLLRAMAGLWSRGSGTIEMPPPADCLFLPQRPYMILADLRSQLLYPRGTAATDATLNSILDQVNLAHLAAQPGGLSAIRDWGRVLSLGEQQRIAFARVLVSQPDFVFLDEATSAVDLKTEAELYSLLVAAGVSFVSIGHRVSILGYHTQALRLCPGGGWLLGAVADVAGEDIPSITATGGQDTSLPMLLRS
jgi:putative ATP-binding cassette transporter